MKNHKVIDVLKSFDPKTSKKFLQFIQSPFTGRSLKSKKLGEYLLSFYPSFDHQNLTEKKAFETLELGKPFSKQELVRYLSKLLAIIEEFIAIDSHTSNPYLRGYLVAEYYYKTKNNACFRRVVKQNNKLLNSSQIDSANYFNFYLNNHLAHNFSRQQRNIAEANQYLEDATSSLDNYYMLQLLQSAIAFYYNQKKVPSALEYPLLPAVLTHLENPTTNPSSLVLLWFLAYKLTLAPDDQELYQELKQRLLLHIKSVSHDNAHSIVVVLNNASIRQLKNNRAWYIKERFDIYQIEINEGWIIANSIINYMTFNNIIVAALALGKVSFATAFLKDYKEYLLPEVYEDIVLYNKARIAFAQKDFSTSLLLVLQVGYFDQSVAIGVKRLQAMCHIELENLDQLTHTLNSLKMYLYRLDGVNTSLKDRNIEFTKVLRLLSKHINGVLDKKTRTIIREIITDHQLIPEMEWIEKKLAPVSN